MEKNNNTITKSHLSSMLIAPIAVFVVLLVGIAYLGDRLHNLENNYVDSNSIHITNAQTVYVPIYSHVYSSGGSTQLLEVTLSIRNYDWQ